MPEGEFQLKELVNACTPWAAREYPRNRHVTDKIRQQLQVLRGHGVVEFVNFRGKYRRTMSERNPMQTEESQ